MLKCNNLFLGLLADRYFFIMLCTVFGQKLEIHVIYKMLDKGILFKKKT